MAKCAKAAPGPRSGARPRSRDVGLVRSPGGTKKKPSASRDLARTAHGVRNGRRRTTERELVRLLDERLLLRMAMLRLLEQLKTAMLALFELPLNQ